MPAQCWHVFDLYRHDLYLICSFVLVNVRAPDSVMTDTYSISVLFHFFAVEVIEQSCWGP